MERKCQNKCSNKGIKTEAKIFDKICNYYIEKLNLIFIKTKGAKQMNHLMHFFFYQKVMIVGQFF